MDGDECLAHRGGGHQHVGGTPSQLLGDLVGDGLLAFVLVGIARGTAVEEEPLVGEGVPERDEIVVDALIDHEVAGRGRHVQHLGGGGPLVAEDERAEARPGGIGANGGAGIARAHHRGRAKAELERGADRGGRGAVLHRARRVRALELDDEAPHAEPLPETRAVEEGRLPLAQRDPVRGIGNGENGRVAPEASAREDRRALLLQPVRVVEQLQQPGAPGALEGVAEGERGAAVDAAESGGKRFHQDRRPKRCSTTSSISSMRWRIVCSRRAGLRAFCPMACASSGWSR